MATIMVIETNMGQLNVSMHEVRNERTNKEPYQCPILPAVHNLAPAALPSLINRSHVTLIKL